MLEREEAEGNGIVVEKDGEMIAAAVAVGKWESRELGGIPKQGGKPAFGFPRSGFSTAARAAVLLPLECLGHVDPLLRSDS
jgi:hypothetical protein